jgi:hypothetical protein
MRYDVKIGRWESYRCNLQIGCGFATKSTRSLIATAGAVVSTVANNNIANDVKDSIAFWYSHSFVSAGGTVELPASQPKPLLIDHNDTCHAGRSGITKPPSYLRYARITLPSASLEQTFVPPRADICPRSYMMRRLPACWCYLGCVFPKYLSHPSFPSSSPSFVTSLKWTV